MSPSCQSYLIYQETGLRVYFIIRIHMSALKICSEFKWALIATAVVKIATCEVRVLHYNLTTVISLVWLKAPALGAGDREFESLITDQF